MRNENKENLSLMKTLREALRRLLRRKPSSDPPPADPYAHHMVPVGRGPKGRSGAAVADVEDDSFDCFPPRYSR